MRCVLVVVSDIVLEVSIYRDIGFRYSASKISIYRNIDFRNIDFRYLVSNAICPPFPGIPVFFWLILNEMLCVLAVEIVSI